MEFEDISSAKIKISVDYYDNVHRKLLNSTSRYNQHFIDNMKRIISNGIEITGAEYLINSLIFKKNTNPNKYTQRDDLINAISSATQYFTDDLEISSKSLRVQENSNPEAATVMKRVGESIGLSVVSRIIGVNEADWVVIPELGIKAFDFRYAVTNKGVVQVETKGSSSADIRKKNNNIYAHAGSIKDKKDVMSTEKKHPYSGDFNYGTISFCPKGGSDNLKCYLLDPPSDSSEIRLEEVRISKKLGFYYTFMSFISPTSKLIDLLRERIIDFAEDKIFVAEAQHLPYYNRASNRDGYDDVFFLNKKSIKLGDSKISGDWFYLKKDHIVFIGIKNSIINDIVLQDTVSLLNYKSEVLSITKEITFDILTGFQSQQLKKLKVENEHISSSSTLKAKGKITILESGVAIGILKVTN